MSSSVVGTVAWLALAVVVGLGAVVVLLVRRLDVLTRAHSDRKWEIARLRAEVGALRRDVHPAEVPDGAGPDGAGPDGAGSDGVVPDAGGPDGAGPDGAVLDAAGSDVAGPDGAGSDGAGSDAAGPGGAGTGGAAADGADPESGRSVRSWPASPTAWRRERGRAPVRPPRRRRPG